MNNVETRVGCTSNGSNKSFVNNSACKCPMCGSTTGLLNQGNGVYYCRNCSLEFNWR